MPFDGAGRAVLGKERQELPQALPSVAPISMSTSSQEHWRYQALDTSRTSSVPAEDGASHKMAALEPAVELPPQIGFDECQRLMLRSMDRLRQSSERIEHDLQALCSMTLDPLSHSFTAAAVPDQALQKIQRQFQVPAEIGLRPVDNAVTRLAQRSSSCNAHLQQHSLQPAGTPVIHSLDSPSSTKWMI